jgi:hypothetical protein
MDNCLTISDIHKIRTDNYEQTKGLSNDELLEKTKQQALTGLLRIAEIRQEHLISAPQ